MWTLEVKRDDKKTFGLFKVVFTCKCKEKWYRDRYLFNIYERMYLQKHYVEIENEICC